MVNRAGLAPVKVGLLLLLLTAAPQALPIPQLMRKYQHLEALERIEARLSHSSAIERPNLLLWKCECLIELGRLEQAEQLLGELPGGARKLLLQGRLSRAQENDDQARQQFEELLKYPPAPETLDGALCLSTLLAEHGKTSECDQVFSRAVEIAEALPDARINWLRLYYQRASQLEKTARLSQAIDWCRICSRHLEKIDPKSTNPLRSLEAMLLGRIQRFEEADRCWSKLIQNHPQAVGSLLAWGYDMLYQRSDLDGCQRFLAASQGLLKRPLPDSSRLHVLLILAQIHLFRLHQHERAELLLSQAQPLAPAVPGTLHGGWKVGLRFHEYGPDPSSELEWVAWMRLMCMRRRSAPPDQIQAYMRSTATRLRAEERGPWLWELSRLNDDLAAGREALAVSRGLQRARLIVSMLQKGRVERSLWDDALNQLNAADQEQAQNFLLETASRAALGFRPSASIVRLEAIQPLRPDPQIERLEARQDISRLIPLLFRQTGRLFLEGRRGEALASAYQMLDWAEKHGEESTAAGALYSIARIQASWEHWQPALELLQRAREIRLRKGERESEVNAARAEAAVLLWSGQPEQARLLAGQYGLTLEAERPYDTPAPVLRLTGSAEFLAACSRLAAEQPQFSTSVAMLPSRMVELAPQMAPDQCLLQVYLGRQEAVLLLASPQGFAVRRLIVSRPLLESWVKTIRHGLHSGRPDPALTEALRSLLLDPLAANLKDRRVTLVCPGLLQDLPWDLLGAEWNSWWLWAGEAAHAYPGSARPQVLGLGDVPGLDLPATRLELEQLAAQFPGQAELLMGTEATHLALEKLASHCDILHLATHASLEQQADQAHLMLADGRYSARQVFACPLKPGALVVLSACNTANTRGQERAPTTLASAFLAAGASQVVATLAPVEDEAARRFFTSFYAQLQAGYPPAQALQRAKRERAASDPDKNWSAFVMLGSCP